MEETTLTKSRINILRSLAVVGAAITLAAFGAARPAHAGYCNTNGCSTNYYGHINIVNNWWGVAGSGTSGSQDVWTGNTSYGYSWGTSYNWSAGNNQYGVKTYGEAADGWAYNGFNGAPFPIKLNSGGNAWTGITNTYASGGSYDVIWDSFYNSNSNPGGANPQAELEVWTTASFGNFGYTYRRSVDGWTWDVSINRGGSWPIITYVPESYVSSENVNIMDISRDAVSLGYLNSSQYLLDIDYGIEVYYGSGNLTVGTYYAP
jgi:hypothetical protein